jgi:hypothetical protein
MTEHLWTPIPSEIPTVERRECRACGLRDAREIAKVTFPSAASWQVLTPCQCPLPRYINYARLVAEIFASVKDVREAQKLVDRIRCVGIPGNWRVGIFLEGEGVVYPAPFRTFRKCGYGFSHLLEWLRERNFQPLDS